MTWNSDRKLSFWGSGVMETTTALTAGTEPPNIEIIDDRWSVSCWVSQRRTFEHLEPKTIDTRQRFTRQHQHIMQHERIVRKQKSIWEPIYSPFSSFFTSSSFSLPLQCSRLIPQITSAFRGIVGHKTELKFRFKLWKPERFPWRKQAVMSPGLSSDLCSWTAEITGSHDSFINSRRRSTKIELFSQPLSCRNKQNRAR